MFQVTEASQTATAATVRRTSGAQRRRGYWTRDQYGRLSWHSYPPAFTSQALTTEFRPVTTATTTAQPLLVWPSDTSHTAVGQISSSLYSPKENSVTKTVNWTVGRTTWQEKPELH